MLFRSLLGFTAQQTLDYLQNLYEKKLCTYPRTDSRYLTGDMADSLPVLVNLVANAMPFRKGIAITCDPQAVINDKKVTDHHAVIPTRNLKDADLSALPAGEKAVLELVALRLLCAWKPWQGVDAGRWRRFLFCPVPTDRKSTRLNSSH